MPDTYVHPDGREFVACSLRLVTGQDHYVLVSAHRVFVPADCAFAKTDELWLSYMETNGWHVRPGR